MSWGYPKTSYHYFLNLVEPRSSAKDLPHLVIFKISQKNSLYFKNKIATAEHCQQAPYFIPNVARSRAMSLMETSLSLRRRLPCSV